MKKLILFAAAALMMASCSIPYDPYDGAIVIYPRGEEQFVTLMSSDTTDFIHIDVFRHDRLYKYCFCVAEGIYTRHALYVVRGRLLLESEASWQHRYYLQK